MTKFGGKGQGQPGGRLLEGSVKVVRWDWGGGVEMCAIRNQKDVELGCDKFGRK